MCSLHLTIQVEQWAADIAAPGEQSGVRCLAQGSHLSRGHFLPEPGFEPTTSGFKSNTLSTRPRLPYIYERVFAKSQLTMEGVKPYTVS